MRAWVLKSRNGEYAGWKRIYKSTMRKPGRTTDLKQARLYFRRCDAANSKRGGYANYRVCEVHFNMIELNTDDN